MAQLTGPEIAALWILNGGSARAAQTWAGIALSQSGGGTTALYNTKYSNLPGYTTVIGSNSPEYSIGLWQINQVAHPQYSTQYLADPNNQARAAIAIANNGTDLGPWTGDPVADAAQANGGYATLAQINQALATEGKSYGGGAVISQATLSQVNSQFPGGGAPGTAGYTAAAGVEGCTGQQTFTFRRPGGCCSNVTLIRGFGTGFVSECQAQGFVGFMLMLGGAVVTIAGIAVLLKGIGVAAPAARALGAVPGVGQVQRVSAQRTQVRQSQARVSEAEQKSGIRMQEREHAASVKRYPKPRLVDINDDEPFPISA